MSLHPHALHPEAEREAAEILEWYLDREPDAGRRFLDALDDAIIAIRGDPRAWSPFVHGTRKRVLHRFPYSVIYRLREDDVQIVAIAHHKRRPGYWVARLRGQT